MRVRLLPILSLGPSVLHCPHAHVCRLGFYVGTGGACVTLLGFYGGGGVRVRQVVARRGSLPCTEGNFRFPLHAGTFVFPPVLHGVVRGSFACTEENLSLPLGFTGSYVDHFRARMRI